MTAKTPQKPTQSPPQKPTNPIISDSTLKALTGKETVGDAVTSAAKAEATKTEEQQKAAQKDQKQEPDKGDRFKVHFRVRIGKLEFINTKGDFLGQPYIKLSTYQHSQLKCIINDPTDELRATILQQSEVEVELGYVDGPKQNVFVGKLYSVGRRPPDGIEIVAVDPSFEMQQQQGASLQFAAEQPIQNVSPTAAIVDNSTVAALTGKESMEQMLDGAIKAEDAKKKAAAGSQPTDKKNQDAAKKKQEADPKPGEAKASTLSFGFAKEDIFKDVNSANTQGKPTFAPAQQFATSKGLKFDDSRKVETSPVGSVRFQQTEMQASVINALQQGDVVVASGNTVKQVAPGKGEPSGCVLDYAGNKSVFMSTPLIFKRTGIQLQSGFGAMTVQGWSVNDKTTVGATVVTPAPAPEHPTGIIQIPDWKQIKLGAPIFPGSSFTWNDATKNGTRVPTKQVMERIVAIAKAVQPYVDKTVGKGGKWNINSWYRDPASNRACGGASGSRHLQGDAIDFYFETNGGEAALHKSLYDSWNGGLAIKPGSFCHMDVGSKRRWTY